MTKQFFMSGRPHNGMTYSEYLKGTEDYIKNSNYESLDEIEKNRYDIILLNLHRSRRISKTYNPGDNIAELISNITSPHIWMVITEDWCGDSAQNLPYIASLAKLNNNINLRILLRDKNLDIMDQYLTNGVSRSIPILVSFNEYGEELFRWGPRPLEGKELVRELKSQGYTKKDLIEKLHYWYAKNRGENIEMELTQLIAYSVMEITEKI